MPMPSHETIALKRQGADVSERRREPRTGEQRHEPLWQRVERNRRRLRAFMAVYVTVSSALVALALVGGVYLSLLLMFVATARHSLNDDLLLAAAVAWYTARLPLLSLATWAVCAVAFALWCVRVLRRPQAPLLGRLGAIPAPVGQHRTAKSCLHRVALAAGIPVPRFAVIPDDSLNAFVVARNVDSCWIGATTGLLDTLSPDELLCVFAHLVARVLDGSAVLVTALAELFDAASEAGKSGDRLLDDFLPDEDDSFLPAVLKRFAAPVTTTYLMVGMCLSLTGAIVCGGYRDAQARTAECADAEGMLLAKDPRGMLGALEKVLPEDNRPGKASEPRFREDVFGSLFFAWPTFSFADDPELARIDRLRETLGAEGAA